MIGNPYDSVEIPLIPDALYGMRGFNVTNDGKLIPLHKDRRTEYKSGVNHARCAFEGVIQFTYGGSKPFAMDWNGASPFHKSTDRVPVKGCTCGYYAYFEDSENTSFMHSMQNDSVNGIVRATGKCIVGSQGFKAEKLEIVALICGDQDASIKQRAQSTLADIGLRQPVSLRAMILFFAVHWTLLVSDLMIKDNPVINFALDCTTLIMWSFIFVQLVGVMYILALRRSNRQIPELKPRPDLVKKIMENYPDVAYFSTMEQAKQHFKLSKASDMPQ